ncbi:cytosolic carboxypeptidase 6 [Chrysoperla carnea]|uniref:cytosolic carboxypeptidase 6 n=1 Tax=Chrysoperla carnea TaxID=189513 RepID=UPI001D0611AD|nr:cytosolic carboxypeptidase 6 [Chrysoperla carnea]
MAYLMPCDPLQMRSMYQREDSEDSDGEGGLGNVNRVLIRPPEHTGKAKKGHLCFDASFECGNLGRVDLISEYEYDLFIRPDTCSPRYRIWFNFTVDNYKQEQRVIFNIVNFSKNKLLFRNGILLPLVKSTSHPYWQRIPSKYVYYHKSQQHFNQYILSIAFAFDKEEEQIYQFSISQPYSYSRLQLYLSSLFIKKQSSSSTINITKELLTTSIQNRNVDLITINNNNIHNNVNNTKQHVIVILSRIHGSESPTSFICQGILEYLTSTQDIYILNYIRKSNIIFKIIPMLNPDGVYLGNYKTNSIGMNLNNNYDKASIFIHPTIYELIKLLKSIDTSNQYHLDFIIDLHAHFNLMGTFIYGSTYDDIYRYERHIILPNMRLGRNLIRTFIEYYKMIGVIIIDDLCYELTTTTTNQHQSRSQCVFATSFLMK